MMKGRKMKLLATAAVAAVTLFGIAPLQAAGPRVVQIKGTDAMQFDKKVIEAAPGETLTVKLTATSSMPKNEMAHNFVLLVAGVKVDSFAMAAAMARDTEYVPKAKAKDVLASTKLAGGGETVEVTFTVPKEPGEYVYLCTFPGHYVGGMKGKLIVK
jgi:azurin